MQQQQKRNRGGRAGDAFNSLAESGSPTTKTKQ